MEGIIIIFDVVVLCIISLSIGINYGRKNPKKKKVRGKEIPISVNAEISKYLSLPDAKDVHNDVESARQDKAQGIDKYKKEILENILEVAANKIKLAEEGLNFHTTVGLFENELKDEKYQKKINKNFEEPWNKHIDTTDIWIKATDILKDKGYEVKLKTTNHGYPYLLYNYLDINW